MSDATRWRRPLSVLGPAAIVSVLALVATAMFGGRAGGSELPPPRPHIPLSEAAPLMFRVDQVGYPVGGPKRVLVMGRHPIRSRSFAVLNAHGRVVLRGRAVGPARWNPHYLVYTLDFGSLRKPGLYTLRFAGTRSPRVRVASARGLYLPLADAALAFLQAQRDGSETIAGPMHRRPAHLDDADAVVYRIPLYSHGSLAGPLTATGAHVDAAGGWFDAGDYLKFVETASFADLALLYTAREYPTGISNLGALLSEARFGTDWLLQMWDQADRVFYLQVGIGDGTRSQSILGDHEVWRLPQADERLNGRPGAPAYYLVHRPVFTANAPGQPISPNLAGRAAAAFALCAQVFATSDPAYAHRCLVAGQTIYDQADTHPHGPLVTTVPHSYYTETEWRDDMELGATELYLATRAVDAGASAGTAGLPHPEAAFYLSPAASWANAYIEARVSGQDSFNLYDVSTLADSDLVRVLREPATQELERTDESVQVPTDVRSLLSDRRDQLRLARRLARLEPFGLANPSTNLDTVAHALGYVTEALGYDSLAGSSAFASLVQSQLDWVLGANAWGSSFIVGAGSVYPHCLASQIPNLAGSLDGRGSILAGAVVQGPTAPSELRELGTPEGARRCPRRSREDPFAAQSGHGLAYLDDASSPATSEPSDDLAALLLLASARLAAH